MNDLSAQLAKLQAQVNALTKKQSANPYPPITAKQLANDERDRKGSMLKTNRAERFSSMINAHILQARMPQQAARGAKVKPCSLWQYNGEMATFIGVNGHEHHGILRPPSRYGVTGMWELRDKRARLVCAFHYSDVAVTFDNNDRFRSPILTHKRAA